MSQKKISDFGINIGKMPKGKLNKITDVKGVTVGHATIQNDKHNTGVTVIMPTEDNIYHNKLVAASFVHNGYGKTAGTLQVNELGSLESPIALTNTLNVGIVSDALVEYVSKRCEDEGRPLTSLNTVVGECNDSMINTITERAVTKEHVFEAIANASADFKEGNVGAGTGTHCYYLKGGIGSSSRIVELGGKKYTVGVLVQSNYGTTADMMIGGKKVGEEISQYIKENEEDRGSIIVVVATDVPVSSRQLRRIIRRASVGIARMGSYIGNGSGEVFLGFSTANVLKTDEENDIINISCIRESKIDEMFRAVGEATEEAILNSMVCADKVVAFNGKVLPSLRDYLENNKL